jgi:hypothetical protein
MQRVFIGNLRERDFLEGGGAEGRIFLKIVE